MMHGGYKIIFNIFICMYVSTYYVLVMFMLLVYLCTYLRRSISYLRVISLFLFPVKRMLPYFTYYHSNACYLSNARFYHSDPHYLSNTCYHRDMRLQ